MASNKSFHLRWNNHLQNLRTLFESIYNEQNLVDVTLSCSDGLLRAHKLVLSACSPYFETVFRDNPCKHPVVILKGIQLQEMQTLLEYMYIGSVDVMEDDLEMLLNVANELQVKGLVQKQPLVNGSSTEKRTPKIENEKKFNKDVPPVHQPEKQWKIENVFSGDPDGLRYTKKKNSNSSKSADNISHGSENTSQGADNSGYYEGLDSGTTDEANNVTMALHPLIKVEEFEDSKVTDPEVDYSQNTSSTGITTDGAASQEKPSLSKTQEMIDEHDEDATFCLICNKNFHSKQNLRRHLQTHTGEKPHRCEYCELSFLRLSHLQRHIRVHTGERPYACSLCPKQFSRSDKLKQHVSLHHTGYQPKLGKKPRGRPRLHPAGSDGQPVPCESVLSSPSTNSPAFNNLSLPMHFSDITVSHVTSPS